MRIRYKMRGVFFMLCTAGLVMTAGAGQASESDSSAFQRYLDSLGISRADLDAKVLSTLMFGGSSPVSFSGEGRFKIQYHQFSDYPKFLSEDKSYVQSNWEGNESAVRLGMVARAGRNTVLYSKIGFQNTLPGNYVNSKVDVGNKKGPEGETAVAGRHDKMGEAAIIHEDMGAGLAIRTVPASFWFRMGAIEWTEASPLTIWKSQPRTFAWEYLPFEVEQPISRYFEYNIAKGEKSGRAAWNKKAFQGINMESINLPWGLYLNLLYGTYERYDNFEREYFDFSGDLAYASDNSNPLKGKGIGDSYRHVFHGRLAANELIGRLTPGLNLMLFNYEDDIVNNQLFQTVFGAAGAFTDKSANIGKKVFYKEPIVGSFDLRGPITEKLNILADFALSDVDTVWYSIDSVRADTANKPVAGRVEDHRWTSLHPAFFARIENKYVLPINADIAVISKGFYSPLSFAAPIDAFYPFGANLLGPGKFVARAEASPYAQNMAGVNLQLVPTLSGYGHLRVTYGQHWQLESARDLIYFPYRLNGQDFFSFLHSSYNRWGNDLVDLSYKQKTPRYTKRLGDETYKNTAFATVGDHAVGYEGGGLRSDYLGMYEGFVSFETIDQAAGNAVNSDSSNVFGKDKSGDGFYRYIKKTLDSTGKLIRTDTFVSATAFVPHHQKFTFNLEADWAYDLSSLLGYSHDMFFSIYGALNGVSTSFKPLAFDDKAKDMLLWGTYVRMEPAIALSNKFYILGLAGFENWRSQKAYIQKNDGTILNKPIDYRDYALGIGFDWDMLARVGLHGRLKYMQHDDITLPENDYKTPVISTEIKMWF